MLPFRSHIPFMPSCAFASALAAITLAVGCDLGDSQTLRVTGQIEGNPIRAGSRVGGRVIEVLVREGDRVEQGAVLVRLEADEAQARVDAANARLEQAKATLQKLEAGPRPEEIRQAQSQVDKAEQRLDIAVEGARSQEIETARANVQTAKAALDDAELGFQRMESLLQEGGVAQKQRDDARFALDAANGRYSAAVEQLDLLIEGTRDQEIAAAKADLEGAQAVLDELVNGTRPEDIAAAKAAVKMAQADVALAQVTLRELTVTAPVAGVVESIDAQAGDLVQPGPMVELVDPDDLEASVYVSAALLGALHIGQKISVTTDSHGTERFPAEIIQLAASGEYTPRNLQTQEERVQQVFGVRLQLDSNGGKLRPGMTITADIPRRETGS